MSRRVLRNIVLLWLGWSVIMIGYMHVSGMRYHPQRPDNALRWTSDETGRLSLRDKPYLLDPFLNTQVAWDSEFYLSVATLGYDDPDIRFAEAEGESYNLSYAFFPLYPMMMKVVRLPFTLVGLTPIAASTAAGVLISLLGTLAAMIALYDIVRDHLDENTAIKVAYLLLIFPSSFFLATVYTEGLFIALSFSSLALMRRDKLLIAAILAALVTWTRATGGILIVPLLFSWGWSFYQTTQNNTPRKTLFWQLPFLFLPVAAYLLWRLAYGVPFDFVQTNWFGNGLFQIGKTRDAWTGILYRALEEPETLVFLSLNIGAVLLAGLSCLMAARRYPRLALFGLLALFVPMTGGGTGTQSAFRYVLAVPTLWVMLGTLSRNVIFDKLWTLFSILLLAMNAYLFSFDFWAG